MCWRRVLGRLRNNYYLTWGSFNSLIEEPAKKIEKDYRPELIVAVARAGLIPGRILSDLLEVKDVESIQIDYSKTGPMKREPKIENPRDSDDAKY